MEINCRGLDGFVAKEATDGVKVNSLVKKVCGETMAEAMNPAGFGYAGFFLPTANILWAPA